MNAFYPHIERVIGLERQMNEIHELCLALRPLDWTFELCFVKDTFEHGEGGFRSDIVFFHKARIQLPFFFISLGGVEHAFACMY